jgi:hypothetical protein
VATAFPVMKLRDVCPPLLLLLIAVMFKPATAAGEVDLGNLLRSRYVHCAFYKKYGIDATNGDPIMVEGRADSLVHFQNIDMDRGNAQAIYTRMAGPRTVTVRRTAKAIHFIDNLGGLYRLTTVHSCLAQDAQRGVCVTYGAAHIRLFDPTVMIDPDAVYEKIKADAEPGYCDHSFVGLRDLPPRR